MAISPHGSSGSSCHNDGQGIVIVLVAVAHAAAVEDQRVFLQIAVTIGCSAKLFEEIRQQARMVTVDECKLIHAGAVIGVVGGHMETVSHATLRVNCAAGI